jgi:flavin-dependent dehydrogenase
VQVLHLSGVLSGGVLERVEANTCDVLIVGGGPAGSTIGTLLASMGWKVTLLEKGHHPRFHIGESLLPMNLPILERLGVLEEVRKIGIVKHAAEFVSSRYEGRLQPFRFSRALNCDYPHAFEVRRSEFDLLLIRNCASKGVQVHEGTRVRDVEFQDDGSSSVLAVDDDGVQYSWQARFVVDASGRDTLLARKFGWKEKSRKHNSAAIFGHFDNVVRWSGEDEGNISIYWFDHGWFWMIPLRDGAMSVGAVCWPDYLKTRSCNLEEFFWQTVKLCPGVSDRMKAAELSGEVRATGNYSYRSRHLYRKGCLLVGDSGAFIDPVFSSGVYLAMQGACLGADVVDSALRKPETARTLMRRYERTMRRGLGTMSWFIHRFTSPAFHHMFMNPTNRFRLEQAVISMLAGDVFSRTPIRLPLLIFKMFYYQFSIMQLPGVWQAYRRRHKAIKTVFSQETVLTDVDT